MSEKRTLREVLGILPAEKIKRLGIGAYVAGTDNFSTVMDKLNEIDDRLTRIEALLSRQSDGT